MSNICELSAHNSHIDSWKSRFCMLFAHVDIKIFPTLHCSCVKKILNAFSFHWALKISYKLINTFSSNVSINLIFAIYSCLWYNFKSWRNEKIFFNNGEEHWKQIPTLNPLMNESKFLFSTLQTIKWCAICSLIKALIMSEDNEWQWREWKWKANFT